MLMANSAAILTDAFPANQRGMALGINQIAGISGQFVGLLLGGLLAAWDWRAVFWVNVPIGVWGTVWAYRSLREIADHQKRAKIDWVGNVLFAIGAASLLAAITYGIQPYGGHATGWTNPAGGQRPHRRRRCCSSCSASWRPRSPSRCSGWACSRSGLSRPGTRPA